jgi:hypothetical protein
MATSTTPAVDAMTDGRRADSTRRRQRVLSALDIAIKDGAELSVTSITHRAGVDARSSTATAICLNASTPPKPSHPTNQASGPQSPAPHCKPTCSQPNNAAPAWPDVPNNSRPSGPHCLANKPSAQPDSAHPPTSTNFSNASSRLSNTSSSYGGKSKNATKDLAAARAANRDLWPSSTSPSRQGEERVLAPHCRAPYSAAASRANCGNAGTLQQLRPRTQ